jgi:CRISPR-associated endonuclease/helicase Cas3
LAAVVARSGANMAAHASQFSGISYAQVQLAAGQTVNRTKAMGEYGFPDRDKTRRIATRLGAEDRLLEFDTDFETPFGTPVRSVKVPHWLATGWPATVVGQATSHTPLEVSFDALDEAGHRLASFHYDRLGLHAGQAAGSAHQPTNTEEHADE